MLKDRPGTSPTYLQFRGDVLLVIVIFVLSSLIRDFADLDKDSTDSPDARSGVALRTDYMTGCQYLESSGGHLTLRLDAEGNHICSKE